MIRLSREIRFSLTAPPDSGPIGNSWGGWPSTNALVPFLELRCELSGKADAQTGYVCNIKFVDDLLREIISDEVVGKFDASHTAEQLVRTVFEHATDRWQSQVNRSLNQPVFLDKIQLGVSPFLKLSIVNSEPNMTRLTQQFEFSAAHRLHCNELSDSDNQATFGKCNNPEGHGHNYVVEVSVAKELGDSDDQSVVRIHEFERVVKKHVIDRLDHKHLNRDVEYFTDINPSVENICFAIFNWLKDEVSPAELKSVRVYETPKTWAEYSGTESA